MREFKIRSIISWVLYVKLFYIFNLKFSENYSAGSYYQYKDENYIQFFVDHPKRLELISYSYKSKSVDHVIGCSNVCKNDVLNSKRLTNQWENNNQEDVANCIFYLFDPLSAVCYFMKDVNVFKEFTFLDLFNSSSSNVLYNETRVIDDPQFEFWIEAKIFKDNLSKEILPRSEEAPLIYFEENSEQLQGNTIKNKVTVGELTEEKPGSKSLSFNCRVEQWTDWSECRNSENGWNKYRSREVIKLKQFNIECPGKMMRRSCMENVKSKLLSHWHAIIRRLDEFGEWGPCTHVSKSEYQRKRILKWTKFFIPQKSEQRITCNEDLDYGNDYQGGCKYTEWLQWSPCSVECGEGIRTRERQAYKNDFTNLSCEFTKELDSCISHGIECAKNWKKEHWTEWSECSYAFNGRIPMRARLRVSRGNGYQKNRLPHEIEIEHCSQILSQNLKGGEDIPNVFAGLEGKSKSISGTNNYHSKDKKENGKACYIYYTATLSSLITLLVVTVILYLRKKRYQDKHTIFLLSFFLFIRFIRYSAQYFKWRPLKLSNSYEYYDDEVNEAFQRIGKASFNLGVEVEEGKENNHHNIKLSAQSNEDALRDLNEAGLSPDLAFWGGESEDELQKNMNSVDNSVTLDGKFDQ